MRSARGCERQKIQPGELTVHADRGAAMTSKPVAFMMADLGITKSHSRPHVSNDNPFSEAQFKTLKYRPDFPDRFGSPEHGRSFCGDFFAWYNTEHHHVGLGLFTPHDVHHGLAGAKREMRAQVLAEAFARHRRRFPNGAPRPKVVPTKAWINPPKGEVVENTMTRKSSEVAFVDPGAFCEADSAGERLAGPNRTSEGQNMAAAQ